MKEIEMSIKKQGFFRYILRISWKKNGVKKERERGEGEREEENEKNLSVSLPIDIYINTSLS